MGKVNEESLIMKIYEAIEESLAGGNQLFCMEMPPRTLNPVDYAYPIENYNSSTFEKPYAVQDKEFRLSDNLFDTVPLTQGPNGSKLSIVYETVLNNLAPNLNELKTFFSDKMDLRMFLLEKITDTIDGEEVTCSRMEFCQRTYLKYLNEKMKWDQEKHEKYITYKEDLDGYAKWLTSQSWTKDEELSNLFNDAIVRGYYHEIMTILGFLDVSSAAERLAVSKMNKRSSVRRSLDGSMDILPVNFQPSDWFRRLKPNFSPTDLTSNIESLKLQLSAKKNLLKSLESELMILSTKNLDEKGQKELEREVALKKEAIRKNESELIEKFSKVAVDVGKVVVDFYSGGMGSVAEGLVEKLGNDQKENIAKSAGIPFGSVKSLIEGVTGLFQNDAQYYNLIEDLVSSQRKNAEGRVSNNEIQMGVLAERIKMIREEVEDLGNILTNSTLAENDNKISDNLPTPRYSQDTEFTEVIITSEKFSEKITDNKSSEAFISKSNFVVAKSSASSSKSTEDLYSAMSNSKFTIGMRGMKVTFDRGGWFDPSVINNSKAYYRISEKMLCGAGLTINEIKQKFKDGEEIHDSKYMLPSFPTGFLIVKDIVLTYSPTDYFMSFSRRFLLSKQLILLLSYSFLLR